MAAMLTACGDYRSDASALPRNEPLTAALRSHAGNKAYTLPQEIQSLNCYFARNGMLCDVVLDVRDPDVAKQLKIPLSVLSRLMIRHGIAETAHRKRSTTRLTTSRCATRNSLRRRAECSF